MSGQTPKPDIFYQIKNQTWAAAAMLAGMELDLFSPLGSGPLTAQKLAAKLQVNGEKLSPLLYALVIAGLLTEQDGVFSNTAETDAYMVRGKPGFLGDTYKIWSRNLQASLKTAETIQTGLAQAKYDWKNMPKEELKSLHEGMASGSDEYAEWLSSTFDFSQCRSFLDAGGGSGAVAIEMTKIHPQMKATVVDLPEVTPITEEFVLEAGAADKVNVLSADLAADPIPGEYDAALLGAVIQTISAEEARKVIRNIGSVMKSGGWLYITGSGILEDSRLSPRTAVDMNLVFINVYDHGQSFTEAEHREWLGEAGFDEIHFLYEESMIRARKRAD
jgi:SAM-dependent methyltransferase